MFWKKRKTKEDQLKEILNDLDNNIDELMFNKALNEFTEQIDTMENEESMVVSALATIVRNSQCVVSKAVAEATMRKLLGIAWEIKLERAGKDLELMQ